MKYILTALTLTLTSLAIGQTKISVEDAYAKLGKKNKIQLIDVRTDKEFNAKHLKNAVQIDWSKQDSFDEKVAKLNKKIPVYVYCLSGGRSSQAAKKLADQGFEVYEIDGGVMKWEAENLPLEKQAQKLESLTFQQFNDITKSNNIVLIDFHASWCGPCKAMAPGIDNIAKNYENRVKVVKIDVDQNSELVKSLKITSIPTVYIYKNGKLTWKKTGFSDQKTLEEQL